jgi:hypothetical protein
MYKTFILMLSLLPLSVFGATFKIKLPAFLGGHASEMPVEKAVSIPNERELITLIDETFNALLDKNNMLTDTITATEALDWNRLFREFNKYMHAYSKQRRPLAAIKKWYPIVQGLSNKLNKLIMNLYLSTVPAGVVPAGDLSSDMSALSPDSIDKRPQFGIDTTEQLDSEYLENAIWFFNNLENTLLELIREYSGTTKNKIDSAAVSVFYAYVSKLKMTLSKVLANADTLRPLVEAQVEAGAMNRERLAKTFDSLLNKDNVLREKMTATEALDWNKLFREFNKYMQAYSKQRKPLAIIKRWYPAVQGISSNLIRDLYLNSTTVSLKNRTFVPHSKTIEQEIKRLEQSVTLLTTLQGSMQQLAKDPGTTYKVDIAALELFSTYVAKLTMTLSKVLANFALVQGDH